MAEDVEQSSTVQGDILATETITVVDGFPAEALSADGAPPEDTANAFDPERSARAAAIVLASIILGFAGNALFFDGLLGVNAVLYTALFLTLAVFLLLRFEVTIVRQHMAFAAPALIFAALLSVRSAPQLVLLNLGAVGVALFVVVEFSSVQRFLGGSFFNFADRIATLAFAGWLEGPVVTVAESIPWFARLKIDWKNASTTMAILRGAILTIPLVILFGGLLTSADAVFGEALENVLHWVVPEISVNFVSHVFLIAAFAWLGMTALYPMLLSVPNKDSDGEAKSKPAKPALLRLSLIESGMMLGTVDLMFAVFIGIQARYLFGGEANITAQGYTYAEYARRGFYELVAVSMLTIVLILALNAITHRKREREYVFQGFAVGMIVLTMLLLVAAYYRLNLYESAYGYTRIRVMSMVFMGWLGLLLAVLMLDILLKNLRLFWLGSAVAAVGFALTLNVMNMDGYIARQNIERRDAAVELDVYYLLTLSDDAIPVLVTLFDDDRITDDGRQLLANDLACRWSRLDREDRSLFTLHFGKQRALSALEAHRDDLTPGLRCAY